MVRTEHRNGITGLTLKLARVERGVSQRALARRLGVSPQRISGIEASYRPTREACARVLDALDELSRGMGRPGIDRVTLPPETAPRRSRASRSGRP